MSEGQKQKPRLIRVHMHRAGIRDEGPLSGTVTFKGQMGEVTLALNDKACELVLSAMADGAAFAVAEVADALRKEFKP